MLMEGVSPSIAERWAEFPLQGEPPMHDLILALVFAAMLIAPCVLALTAKLDDIDPQ